jgi:hypothetical protein
MFISRISLIAALLLLSPSVSFTVVSDHPRVGEVPQGCGLQYGTAPVRIPISF